MPDNRPQITDDFAKLCDIVAKLRAPEGCPWDREQTNKSLVPALIEEAYETAEAARSHNDTHFREELGDLLLLVVMHAQIARENGRFAIDDVIGHVSDKLIRRHPHVFGTSEARDAGAVLKQWEAIKREEKKRRLALSRQFAESVAGAGPRTKGAIQSSPREFRLDSTARCDG